MVASRRPLVIAHRGASGDAPEHTAAAYAAAVEQGADLIEGDLQVTRDGAVVSLHDATLERVTAGASTAAVSDLTLAQLRELEFGSWFATAFRGAGPVTLQELLALGDEHPDLRFMLELKTTDPVPGRLESAVVGALLERGWADGGVAAARALVESFDLGALARVKRQAPEVPTVYVWYRLTPEHVACDLPADVDAVAPHAAAIALRPEVVANAHATGRAVFAWTVDDPEELLALAELGVDGVFTDRPGAVRAVFDAAGDAGG
ncbi:MAG: glycerophosphodiester phosphodiesterase [Actinobacteria bacterium]|nr:glycerophosphodiester phosphodiesterase [Actinomycetota bacterium]MCA1722577.1 glycerophosphodiester phosphodiesterase [Actinomycetota bacterium]